MAYTEEQLRRIAAQHGGEAGRSVVRSTERIEDPDFPNTKIENPEPDHLITYNDGTKAVVRERRDPATGRPTGIYDPLDLPAAPAAPSRGGAPYTTTNPATRGLMTWNEAEGRWEDIVETIPTPTEPREAVRVTPQGRIYRGIELIGLDPEQAAEYYRKENRQATLDDQKAAADYFKQLQDERKYTAEQAETAYKQWIEQNVTIPKERAAQQLQIAQEERLTLGEVARAAEAAGEARAKDLVATIPYRYSPGFAARRADILNAGLRGSYAPAAARPVALPDLGAARMAGEQAGRAQAASLLGVDLAGAGPAALGAVPPYAGPPAAGAVLPSAEDDAAEWARRLQGARARIGTTAFG